jgi:hypothetical protein
MQQEKNSQKKWQRPKSEMVKGKYKQQQSSLP